MLKTKSFQCAYGGFLFLLSGGCFMIPTFIFPFMYNVALVSFALSGLQFLASIIYAIRKE